LWMRHFPDQTLTEDDAAAADTYEYVLPLMETTGVEHRGAECLLTLACSLKPPPPPPPPPPPQRRDPGAGQGRPYGERGGLGTGGQGPSSPPCFA